MYLHVCACNCVSVGHTCAGAHGSQKRVSDPQEMEVQVVMNPLTWVLTRSVGVLVELLVISILVFETGSLTCHGAWLTTDLKGSM